MSSNKNLLKKIFTGKVNRTQFLLRTIMWGAVFGSLGAIGLVSLLKPLVIAIYVLLVAARVRDWEGKPYIWLAIVGGIIFMSHTVLSIPMNEEDYQLNKTFYGGLLLLIHVFLSLKKGKHQNEKYESVKKNILDSAKEYIELWKLKSEKRKLDRKQMIESLRDEVGEIKNPSGKS